MPIATPAEVQTLLALGSDDLNGRLPDMVTAACELVEMHLNRKLPRGSYTETHSGGSDALVLKAYPVESVSEVMLEGTAMEYSGLNKECGLLYRKHGWPCVPGGYSVTYTGGLDPVPMSVKQAVALLVEALVDAMDNKGQQIASESLSDYQVSYFRTGEAIGLGALSGAAAALLAPYRHLGF